MRTSALMLALLVVVAGCRSTGTTTPPSTSPTTLAQCVGGGAGGPGAVIAGTENEFFRASARQVIHFKPGVEASSEPDKDGERRALTLTIQERRINLNCGCPSGCSEAPGDDGCDYIIVIGSRTAFCVGECEKPNACCSGCGWY